MQSGNEESLLDIIDLAHSLRQEQLFITHEQNSFAQLNEKLNKNSLNLSQLAWICAQQKQNLNNLIISRPDSGPSSCCHRANILENTKFIDAYKATNLKYPHVLAYIALFNYLHGSPYLLGQCLAIGDRLNHLSSYQMNTIIQTITNGLYGNGVNSKDVEMLLKLLQELIEIQIVVSDNPRRMLRPNSSAFSRLYQRFHESSFSAKLFLTAVLNGPIMKVLIDDEIMLDIDPTKAVNNIPSKEKFKKFGLEGTQEYHNNIKKYHDDTIDALYQLTNSFIKSLTSSWVLFPSTLRWLVQTMGHFLKQAQISEKDINAILTDMVFTNFICPAIVSPDIYGITDAPVSENARFNLIQIGKIIQMLALIKYQKMESKQYLDLYDKFDHDVIANLLEQILPNDYEIEDIGMITIPATQNNIGNNSVLVTQLELNTFVEFLRSVLDNDGLIISGEDRRKLGEILDQLPDKLEALINGDSQNNNTIDINGTPSKTKQTFINLGKQTKNKLAKTMSLNISALNGSGLSLNEIDDQVAGVNSVNSNNIHNQHQINNNSIYVDDYEQVLIIPISNNSENKFQLMSEDQVLTMNIANELQKNSLTEKNVEELSRRNEENVDNASHEVTRENCEKHTRFSRDDASIGNTSDNFEAVSEAPSNHSVASSLDLEENDQNDNDNLSDMVSANVSGRGTPNISGRDTPSSQVTEGGGTEAPTPQMAKMLNKARSDIQDKFCKFEIKKLNEGDETISIISDTWSTDVLASDSETIEANERNFSTPLIPAAVILPGDHNYDPLSVGVSQLRSNNLDISETQSESAWSTDVLASDSEKMTEIDTDDNQSIAARSDITDSTPREHDSSSQNINNSNSRTPDSPFFAPRTPNSIRSIDSAIYSARTPESVFSSHPYDEASRNMEFRQREDFPRYSSSTNNQHPFEDNANNRDGKNNDNNNNNNSELGAVGGIDIIQNNANRHNKVNNNNPFSSNSKYDCLYLGSANTMRQNSVESFSSTHSSNFEQAKFSSPIRNSFDVLKKKNNKKEFLDTASSVPQPLSIYEMSDGPLDEFNAEQNSANFIDFENLIGEKKHAAGNKNKNVNNDNGTIIKTNTNLINPFADEEEPIISVEFKAAGTSEHNMGAGVNFCDDDLNSDTGVEHRRISSEQRNANFDSRRNGMTDILGHMSAPAGANDLLFLNALPSATSTNIDFLAINSTSTTDDFKNQQNAAALIATTSNTNGVVLRHTGSNNNNASNVDMLLLDKTNALNLNESNGENGLLNHNTVSSNSNNHNNINNISNNHSNSKSNILPNGSTPRSSKCTGAIPKSISFDSSADKADKNGVINHNSNVNISNSRYNDGQLRINGAGASGGSGGGFFHKIKQNFKSMNRRSSKMRQADIMNDLIHLNNSIHNSAHDQYNHNNTNGMNGLNFSTTSNGMLETSEDILAKYRRKASSSSDAATSDSTGSNNSSSLKSKSSHSDGEQRFNNENVSYFNVAKKKLRLVLSSTDLYTSDFRHNSCGTQSPLVVYLQIQLAQALHHHNHQQISYVSEVLRCLNTLDKSSHRKLLRELQIDLKNRQSYIQYLIRYKQYLLSTIENVDKFEERLRNDREICNKHLIMVCVRMFLEKREQAIVKFHNEFIQLTVIDEKLDLLEEFIAHLIDDLKLDGILQGMADVQLQEARNCIERILLQRVYHHVMFPNDDADISRDQVLHDHIRKLSRIISPTHSSLRIPQTFLNEAPWPFAQQQIAVISAYKTPKEKVQCVVKCIQSIMNLLSMAERVSSADDLTPVLIYVIIQANPPYLLSTIEYVDRFVKLEGEDLYWWIQFCSAVTFIKTMDYGD